MTYLEGNDLLVFYYLRASEIWSDKRCGLWWELPYKRCGLWWELSYKSGTKSGLIRGVAFGGSCLIRGGLNLV